MRGPAGAQIGGGMNGEQRPAVAVLGMGNLIYSDDGAGLRALRQLEKDPALPAGVDIVDGSAAGLPVVNLIENAERLLILDAVHVGAVPGTVVRLDDSDLKEISGVEPTSMSLGSPT